DSLQADPVLQERLTQIADLEGVTALANGLGFKFSVEELQRAKAEISESDVEALTGGACSLAQCLSIIPH
ncbi:MAG: Nif11-like leader peptide family RiPP precursor, partial [Cyanobacteriota bacterium]|nr:Nif11-like leader peptide family RiPP precursor [Cyanobacteriota bacterium]